MDSTKDGSERMQFTECMQKSLQGMVDFYNEKPKAKK
jgi:hypothetical protein